MQEKNEKFFLFLSINVKCQLLLHLTQKKIILKLIKHSL